MNRELGFYINPHSRERRRIMQNLSAGGVRWLGIDGTSWHAAQDKARILEFKNEMKEYGLKLYSMHSCLPVLAVPGQPLPEELFSAQKQELRKGQLLESSRIVYHSCHFRDCPFPETDQAIAVAGEKKFMTHYAAAVSALAEYAAEMNIVPVFENIYFSTYSESFDFLKKVLEMASTANTGICIDSGHAFLAGGNPADSIRKAGSRLRETHFHDNFGRFLPPCISTSPSPYRFDLHLPPGLGLINWPEICMALDEIKYSGPIMFEGVLASVGNEKNTIFKGRLTCRDLIRLTIDNWRAFESLALK
ncbi:MAG: Xylose isomerase-like TIM barrel [Lentisphaerae bacterium ADurb.Bin242]|nr:MAG: Xylose isomerase-like TIM barrel [Lentisphaerae bacterium ADurb.Bin242]